jgi:serine/threonine-protein kinase RsbW
MPQLPSRATAQLTVPATTAYLRHVRILAATIADDCAFDVEAIESLRVAVDELCALAMADATDDAELVVSITTTGRAVELEGRCSPVTEEPVLDPIAEQLLRAGSSHHALHLDGDTVHLELRAERTTSGVAGGS